MSIIRSLAGLGALSVDGEHVANVRYRIDVSRVGIGRLSAAGSLHADGASMAELFKVFNLGHATLALEKGGTVEIVPSNMSPLDSPPSFKFAVSGPVPGFEP